MRDANSRLVSDAKPLAPLALAGTGWRTVGFHAIANAYAHAEMACIPRDSRPWAFVSGEIQVVCGGRRHIFPCSRALRGGKCTARRDRPSCRGLALEQPAASNDRRKPALAGSRSLAYEQAVGLDRVCQRIHPKTGDRFAAQMLRTRHSIWIFRVDSRGGGAPWPPIHFATKRPASDGKGS